MTDEPHKRTAIAIGKVRSIVLKKADFREILGPLLYKLEDFVDDGFIGVLNRLFHSFLYPRQILNSVIPPLFLSFFLLFLFFLKKKKKNCLCNSMCCFIERTMIVKIYLWSLLVV